MPLRPSHGATQAPLPALPREPDNDPIWLSVKATARRIGISVNKLRSILHSHGVEGKELGTRTVLLNQRKVDAVMDGLPNRPLLGSGSEPERLRQTR